MANNRISFIRFNSGDGEFRTKKTITQTISPMSELAFANLGAPLTIASLKTSVPDRIRAERIDLASLRLEELTGHLQAVVSRKPTSRRRETHRSPFHDVVV